MAYDYDVDILAALWTGAEDGEEPYASFIAANPDITNQTAEVRILSSIELLRSHMELLASREEARQLHFAISRLIRHTAGGSNPYSDEAKVTKAEGNVKVPSFPAGASLDITIDGSTASGTSASGGDINTVIAEINASIGSMPAVAEVTDLTIPDDVDGSLGGTHFTLNSAGDATNYYVWFNHSGRAEAVSLDFTGVTGGTLPTGAVAAAFFDIDSTTGGYRVWFDDGSTTAPAAGGRTLVPVSFTGGDTDTVIAASVDAALGGADADFIPLSAAAAVVSGSLASVGDVTDPVDGGVSTGATIASTVQGVAAAVDPAPGGTGISVAYAIGEAGSEIDNPTSLAISGAGGDFTSESGTFTPGGSLGSVTVTNTATGSTTDAADVDSGVSVSVATQGTDGAGAVPVQAFKTNDNRLGFRATTDFLSFEISNGSGGVIGPAGIIPGPRRSKPAQVSDEGRDAATNNYVGRRGGNA